ncbi:SusC/RagA family TonB-linked outer membrane protein [Bacteroides sp. GM023]|uniref:SusC/RagA family TonB-linked outer membrane protein n=1 Tax=Bacteroides sp. GM023 TaxID=2723058 RepID=UPI00168B46B6|nr:SusC/RagA family TonB-linked outer membrane protein [Bacteroides sp. GM023]MBD3588681.1 SusC/RagA family TonB-linked outer membrane protein [Bacteroides sp. GM023]
MTNKFISKGLMMAVALMLSCTAPLAYAQTGHTEKITVTVTKKSLENVLEKLSKQYNYQFFYNASLLKGVNVSVSLQEADINSVMKKLLEGTGLQYSIKDRTIVITTIPKKAVTKTLLHGRITDSDGNYLPGVAIFTQDKSQAAVTDIDGRFSFSQPLKYGSVLQFTSVGMKPHNVVYSGEGMLQVVMIEDVKQLDAVIVTGYQTISRERATGAAVIINKEKIDKIQSTNLMSKLEGMSAGLSTYGGTMSIRGTSSFAVGTSPLIVLDGQVVNQGMSGINPENIENITVLKDAASTSLYGVRASNGVIVITTKKPKDKKAVINASANFYFRPVASLDYQHYASTSDIVDYEVNYLLTDSYYKNNPMDYFDKKNDPDRPQSYTQIERLYYEMAKGNMTQAQVEGAIEKLREYDYRKEYQDKLTQMAFTQDYNVSLSKGGDKSDMFTSIRFQDFGSNSKASMKSNKLSFYLKNSLDFTKWLKFTYGTNIDYQNGKSGGGDYGSLAFMPYERITDDNGNPVYQYMYNYYRAQEIDNTEGLKSLKYNVMDEYRRNATKTRNLYLRLFTQLDLKIAKGLDLDLKFQYEDNYYNSETYDEEDSFYMRNMIDTYASSDGKGGFTYNIPEGGHMKEQNRRSNFYNVRGQLNYNTTLAEKHNITALLGGEVRQDKWRTTNGERYGYNDQKLTYKQVNWMALQEGVIGQLYNNARYSSESASVSEIMHRYVSGYANVGYTYDSRYSFNGSIRIEQADLFGTDPKYRYRPLWSVGLSWNINNEEFMKPITWLNLLKLRMTYGITGNVDQNTSPYLIGVYLTNFLTNTGVTEIMTPPNPMLRWEKTATFNFGVDFAMLKRLNGSFDVYRRYSSDLLANKTLDASVGWAQAVFNNGAMKNIGMEISLSYDWLKTRDWALNTSLTASYNKNKIEKIGYVPTSAKSMITSPYSNYMVGDTYGTMYAFRYAGLTSEGDPSVYDENGEIKSNVNIDNTEAIVKVGQLTPKWQGAFNVNLRWKSVEMFAKIVYYTGHSLRKDVTPIYQEASAGMHEDFVNRWTPDHTDTDIPRMGLHNAADTYRSQHWKYADKQVTSASFIKMRNIGLSYTLPQKLTHSWGFNNISVRAQVDNPFYWAANHNGIDPEAFNANAGTRTAEQVTSYVVGLNINF